MDMERVCIKLESTLADASRSSMSAISFYEPSTPSSPSPCPTPIDPPTPASSITSLPHPEPAPLEEETPPVDATTAAKKPTKKRKSWGQVLPEPKTCLPPRKRAKTEDEKEQRRVERVLRNRRAAQSSRERKRQEVDALEKRNKELECRLEEMARDHQALIDQIDLLRQSSGLAERSSASPHGVLGGGDAMLCSGPFDSHDRPSHVDRVISSLINRQRLSRPPSPTVDPKSISPQMQPAQLTAASSAGSTTQAPAATASDQAAATPTAKLTTSDLTQRPAAMLCDLQCHSSDVVSQTVSAPTSWSLSWMLVLLFQAMTMQASLALGTLTTLNRPLLQISRSLTAGFSIAPSSAALTTVIWLLTHRWTLASSSMSSRQARRRIGRRRSSMSPTNSNTSSPRQSTRQTSFTTFSVSLRTRFLRKLLSSSPSLARPLEVATVAALRLVASDASGSRAAGRPWQVLADRLSQGSGDLGVGGRCDGHHPVDPAAGLPWFVLMDGTLPSRESLMTLLWVLRHRRHQLRNQGAGRGIRRQIQEEKRGCTKSRCGGRFGYGMAGTGSE